MSFQPNALAGPTLSGAVVTYVEFNTDVTISATTEATANTVVTAGEFNASGVDAYIVEFYSPGVNVAAAVGAQIRVSLYDNGAAWIVGASVMGLWLNPASVTSLITPAPAKVRVVPSAGKHQFSVRGWQLSGNGVVYGTVAGISLPGFIMVTRAT